MTANMDFALAVMTPTGKKHIFTEHLSSFSIFIEYLS
jgi:hypothetical protein